MKRTLVIGALALSTSLTVFAQQAPTNAPNPSKPPIEGSQGTRLNSPAGSGTMSGTATTTDSTHMSTDSHGKKEPMNKRSSKPRQKDAPASPTADAPSGPKGDSPSPAPKN